MSSGTTRLVSDSMAGVPVELVDPVAVFIGEAVVGVDMPDVDTLEARLTKKTHYDS